MVFKIFISYSQDDFLAKGKKLRNYLAKVIPDSFVYIDQNKPKGQDWRQINDENLLASDLVLLIITPAVLHSDEVKREIALTLQNKITLLPCKHEDLLIDWPQLPLNLGKKDGIDFEDDEVLKTRSYREIMKIIQHSPKSKIGHVTTEIIQVMVENQKFAVPIITKGGGFSILSTNVDRETSSLILNVRCLDLTTMSLRLPRMLIDSKDFENDDKFFVLVNGKEIESIESGNDEGYRIITFTCESGVNNIEIIGTSVLGISYGNIRSVKHRISLPKGSANPNNQTFAIPETITIKQGDAVTWTNEDTAAHTITSRSRDGSPSGIFNSNLILSGHTFSVTFSKKGSYEYYCMVHPWKSCMVNVE